MPQSYRTERELFKPDTSYKSALFERNGRRFHPGKYDYGDVSLPGYELKSEYDEETGGMKVYETFNGQKVFYERELTLNEYLNEVKNRYQEKKWDSIASDYDLKKAFSGGDLARLMSTATGFSIPLPPNPIFSIFGSPKISINVNGEVNVRVGWRWNTQNLGTVSQFGQTPDQPLSELNATVRQYLHSWLFFHLEQPESLAIHVVDEPSHQYADSSQNRSQDLQNRLPAVHKLPSPDNSVVSELWCPEADNQYRLASPRPSRFPALQKAPPALLGRLS